MFHVYDNLPIGLSLAMTYVGGYAGYNNLPIFGWLSDSSTLNDKTLYNSLVRTYGPINVLGKHHG